MKPRRITRVVYLLLIVLVSQRSAYAQAPPSIRELDMGRIHEPENLNVFQQWIRWNNGGSLLMNHLTNYAFELYTQRTKEIAKLKTERDWRDRQQLVREKLMAIIGPFPEKTPLRPVVTGVIKKSGYRIEKVVFESMPGFFVTGCLFIPDKIKGKAPAVLNLIGHEQESFRAVLDQVLMLNLVKKGIVVFTIDPLGQGEHVQYFDEKVNFSSVGYSVIEHCYFGNQCFLAGVSSARYFLWDAIRAIDYMVSRKEIDGSRIGVTGFSGGGTITSYVGALDDRVRVAIPSSWSNATQRQLETKGAQDAEATLVRSVAMGITFEDLIEVRAPKPTMFTFTSRDEYLCLQGAREAYIEAKQAYKAFGRPDDLQMVEDDSKHWLTPKIREAIYGFFMKHLNVPGDTAESEVDKLSMEELTVTRTGQISNSLGGDMVFDVLKRDVQKLVDHLNASRENIDDHLRTVVEKAKTISGFRQPSETASAPFINGRYQRGGYSVGKYALEGENDYVIPILQFMPADDAEKHPAIVYLHPDGKAVHAVAGGEIEKLVKAGYVVIAPDVLGIGETANTASRGLADGYMGVLTGKSVVGIQAGDIVRVVNYMKTLPEVDEARIGAVAFGKMSVPLLHAAAFDGDITSLTLVGSLTSYRSVAMNRHYRIGVSPNEGGGYHHPYEVEFSWGIAGVLTAYDLPDLMAGIAPRRIVLADIRDQMLQPASPALVDLDLDFPRTAYAHHDVSRNMKIVPDAGPLLSLVNWSME